MQLEVRSDRSDTTQCISNNCRLCLDFAKGHLSKLYMQGDNVILPLKTKNPPESLPFSTFGLIFLNVLIFAITSNGLVIHDKVVDQFALTRANFGPMTFLSSMFLHGDIFHLLGNMWFLWLMGAAVEGRLRTFKFLILYFLSGLTGDGLHMLMTLGQSDIPSLGASGAIMGLLGAALWMFPHSKVKVGYYFALWWHGIWEWRMWGVALYYLGFDLLGAVIFPGSDGVAHFAHLGGALGGFLVALALRAKRDDPTVSDAKSELADVNDLRALSKYELSQLALAQPDNPDLALAWLCRTMDHGGIPPHDAVSHFLKHAKVLARTGDIEQVGQAFFTLSQTSGQVPAAMLLDVGTRLEREGRPQMALPLLERALQSPDTNDAVAESAVFKLGMLQEAWFQNHTRALELFREHQSRWPMSPMEQQVKSRIAILSTKV